jgi:hypothetical protein
MTVIAARRQIGGSGPGSAFLSNWIGLRPDFFDSARDLAMRSAISERTSAANRPWPTPARPADLRYKARGAANAFAFERPRRMLQAACSGVWLDQEREETGRCLGRSLLLLLAPCWDHPWHRSAPRPPEVAGSGSTPPLMAAGPTGPSSWRPVRLSSSRRPSWWRRPSSSRLSFAGLGSAGTHGSGAASSFDHGLSRTTGNGGRHRCVAVLHSAVPARWGPSWPCRLRSHCGQAVVKKRSGSSPAAVAPPDTSTSLGR